MDDVKIRGIIREPGFPLRTEKSSYQLTLSSRYPEIQLIGRNLTDLIPGLTYVIDPVTTNDLFEPFSSRKDAFQFLYPSKWEEIESNLSHHPHFANL